MSRDDNTVEEWYMSLYILNWEFNILLGKSLFRPFESGNNVKSACCALAYCLPRKPTAWILLLSITHQHQHFSREKRYEECFRSVISAQKSLYSTLYSYFCEVRPSKTNLCSWVLKPPTGDIIVRAHLKSDIHHRTAKPVSNNRRIFYRKEEASADNNRIIIAPSDDMCQIKKRIRTILHSKDYEVSMCLLL